MHATGTARSAVVRRMIGLIALAVLTACSRDGPGRAAIVDRCVAGGEAPEVCKCLADASSQKLDADMFELIVLGAQGEETKTDQRIGEMTPDQQAVFAELMRGIVRGCGAQDYLVGG